MNSLDDISKAMNFNGGSILNSLLITNDGYKFGFDNETISSVLRKNLNRGTLTAFGDLIVMIINMFDENHI